MSEVKLNLIDAHTILTGTIHGSVADSCVAALSAEPETIAELEAALARYIKPHDGAGSFASFRSRSEIDPEPWDAGLVLIDLPARIVAAESSYSQPSLEGEVRYHDGTKATDVSLPYRLPADWLFVNSVEAYRWSSERRRKQRAETPPFDARAILYGPPLLEFIVSAIAALAESGIVTRPQRSDGHENGGTIGEEAPTDYDLPENEQLMKEISRLHANWLMTPREDLRGRSPREVLLEKRDLIDFDLQSRELQWTFLGEGPPCLARDSCAYRFACFGTHEWVVYYDLVRHLLWTMAEAVSHAQVGMSQGEEGRLAAAVTQTVSLRMAQLGMPQGEEGRLAPAVTQTVSLRMAQLGMPHGEEGRLAPASLVRTLDQIKINWLEQPQSEFDGRIPAVIIDNERKRLPQAMSAAEIMIDEDCECCRMMAQDAEMGFGPTFWHLDGCNMDDEFAFSTCVTIEEWEAKQREWEEFNREFERKMEDRRQRLARGEELKPDPFEPDPFEPDPFEALDSEPS